MTSLPKSSRSLLITPRPALGPAAKLKLRSWSVFVLVAGLLVAQQFLLQPVLNRLDTDGPIINVAGRQRMLSQKLAKAALAFQAAHNREEAQKRRDELNAVVTEWSRAHYALQQGDEELRLPGTNDATIRAAYSRLEPHYRAIQNATRILLADQTAMTSLSAAQRAAIQTILQHEEPFLAQMHELVGLHAASARSRVWQLQALGWGIVATILGLLLAIQALVIRPAVDVIGNRLALWEAQYRRLVESMSEGVVVHDADGRIQLVNRRFCELIGLHVDDILGQKAHQFIAASHQIRYSELVALPFLRNAPVELVLQQSNGGTVDTMASIQFLSDEQDLRDVFLLVVTDISAHKQAEKKSRELQMQLTHANRLKSMGELAAGLAHELNQPLAAIANYAEAGLASLPDQSVLTETLQTPLQRILSAALRGGEIVRRTRRFSQRAAHEVRPESLNDLVRDIEMLYRHEALCREVKVEMELAADLPLLPLDGLQTQQVLANLIQNGFAAMEHTPPHLRRLRIVTERESPDFVLVSVSDTGTGIPEGEAARLFEPFFTTRTGGLGLGLAIAQNIVAAHGGTISASNNEQGDGGAIFRFTLATHASAAAMHGTEIMDEMAHV